MDISLIICTYNRAKSLRQTLQTCCDLIIPDGVTWELLVVDNNSTDHTKVVCESFSGKLPLRYLFVKQQGKTCAQNAAIETSTGSLLAFTDDDVEPDSQWLVALWQGLQRNPNADILGGKILPRWSKSPKKWVLDHAQLLGGVITYFDMGDVDRSLPAHGPLVFGANMAFRRHVFNGPVRFREDMGPRGNVYMTHEETSLIRQLIVAGHQCLYLPEAVVHHRTPAERATEAYVRNWFTASGKSEVRLEGLADITHAWFGVPRYLWRKLLDLTCRYVLTRRTRPSGVWLRHEISMATTWGIICEYRQQSRLRKTRKISN